MSPSHQRFGSCDYPLVQHHCLILGPFLFIYFVLNEAFAFLSALT